MYYSCYKNCFNCSAFGTDPETQKCDLCLNDYPFYYVYNEGSKIMRNCYENKCELNSFHPLHIIDNENQCFDACPNGIYNISNEKTCFHECEENYGYIDGNKNECVNLTDKHVFQNDIKIIDK